MEVVNRSTVVVLFCMRERLLRRWSKVRHAIVMFVVVSFMNWLGDVMNDLVDNWFVVDNLVMDGSHMIVFLASFGYFRVFLGLMVSLMRLLFRIGVLL